MKITRWLWVIFAALLWVACIVQPSHTPPPTATLADPLRIADTPTPPAVSTPTPSLLTVGDRTFKQWAQPPLMTIDPAAGHTAIIHTNKGAITLELFASEAPVTVNNFVFLAREGFYNEVIFHRVLSDLIQTETPREQAMAGPAIALRTNR